MSRVHQSLVAALGGWLVFVGEAGAASIPGLFNTGVDRTGAVLAFGSPDSNYSLTGEASGAMVIHRRSVSGTYRWVEPPPGSAWIGHTESNQRSAVGLYVYTMTFDLTGLDPTTALISGELAADNSPRILLNGSDTGFNHGQQYKALKRFHIAKSFVAGINTLEFRVHNNPNTSGVNPSGLLVANLQGTAKTVLRPLIAKSEAAHGIEICWQSELNEVYRVDYRPDLSVPGQWVPLFSNLVGSGEMICVTPPVTGGLSQGFYRVYRQTR